MLGVCSNHIALCASTEHSILLTLMQRSSSSARCSLCLITILVDTLQAMHHPAISSIVCVCASQNALAQQACYECCGMGAEATPKANCRLVTHKPALLRLQMTACTVPAAGVKKMGMLEVVKAKFGGPGAPDTPVLLHAAQPVNRTPLSSAGDCAQLSTACLTKQRQAVPERG